MTAIKGEKIIPKQKVCLIVIDGWGIRQESHGNAILNANTPNMDKLSSNSIQIEASETNVGLPDGQMGNSEVGHLNLGAGRIVYQDIVRINLAISNDITKNEALIDACDRAKKISGSRIHLVGLCSDGGVHAHINHIMGIVSGCKKLNISQCFIHFISDGRDTSPTSGLSFIDRLTKYLEEIKYGKLSTIVGRYYAMDRDKNWERTKIAFDAMCYGTGTPSTIEQITSQIQSCYDKGQKFTDEFLAPFVFGDDSYRIKDNDTVIFLNYRSDRMRQIVTSFGGTLNFQSKLPSNLEVFCMTQYDPKFTFKMLFPPLSMENVLAEWLSRCNIPQLHVAETEKFAHVTFFFNGGIEKQFDQEDRVLVPSPKVPTFDVKPEMSCHEVADKVIEGIQSDKYPFIMLNFAPPDMVGHTGFYQATLKACEATDIEIGRIFEACEKFNYVLMVTADHGNAEMMYDQGDKPYTAHTLFPVPLIITKDYKLKHPSNRKPALCDVAPTVLEVMGVPLPSEMTGVSLLVH